MLINDDRDWLDLKRLKLYSRTAALVFLILAIGLLFHSNVVDPKGFSLGFDFSVFWSASQLALLGHPADAYQLPRLHSIIQTIHPEVNEGSYGWFYPPNYFLIIAPLAYFSYYTAYLLFISLTLAAYGFVVKRVYNNHETLWCLAGFSGLWDNLVTGQNGFLTAAIAGTALLILEKRPVLAGMLIGMLSIKPQLALLFPVALIAIQAWKTLLIAILTGIFSMAASTAVLGLPTFEAWLQSAGLAKALLETGGTHFWTRMPTIFSFLHLLGVPVQWAYLAHFSVAAGIAFLVWKIWKRCSEAELRNAALITGSLLISPYVLIYDLTWLALPIAWMARIGVERGWLRLEREILILAWLLPLCMLSLSHLIPIQMGPWVLLFMLALISRRVFLTPGRHAATGK
ncbi:MAG: DUF2029 domain-containing protein [Ferrovum sp.]|nr:DUF2029 domain-containing protein [Ferrovum sp.]